MEQHYISHNHIMWETIDDLCWKSKNLYNAANYIVRNEFITNGKYLSYLDVVKMLTGKEVYSELGSNVGQATLRLLDKNWKAFFSSIKDWKKNPSKYLGRPRLPKYKDPKSGRFYVGLDNNKVKLKDGKIYFSWKKLKKFNGLFTSKIPDGSKIIQCRFIPNGPNYMMEVIYEIEVPEQPTDSKRIASIDLGIHNFVTMTNNIGLQPIVIKGGVIRSINQYSNKLYSKYQSELKICNGANKSRRLERIATKRKFKLKHEMHNISKWIIGYCVENRIDTLVCGLNKGWKQEVNLGHTTNRKFVEIPFYIFINMLSYKCENAGIRFITTDESYTSGTSFLDGELPVKDNYDIKRRKHRGIFVSISGQQINADVNGSYQIMMKVFPEAFADGIEGAGLHPMTVKTA